MNARRRWPLLLTLGLFCMTAQPAQPLALMYQDHILRIAVARQQLTAEQANGQMRAFQQRYSAEPEPDQVHALRKGLDEAFEGWLSAIEQQAATTSNWPEGRSAADWQLMVQVNVAQLRESMLDALIADQDPLPILQKTAQVDGWTRGESSGQPTFRTEGDNASLHDRPLPLTLKPPAEDQQVRTAHTQRLHFDQWPVGPLPSDAFSAAGVRIVTRDGVLGIYAADASMVLPVGRSQVLLVAGERTTSLTFELNQPVRRFALTRIGTASGSSVPTWTLHAFDSKGAAVGSTGEEFHLPARPQQFSIEGAGIVRVVLSTDNRHGEGTLATWNSLPVVEFEFER